MLDHFLVFDTRGVVHYEEGLKPHFRDSYIQNIDLDVFKAKDKVRDVFVLYKVSGLYVYLAFAKTNDEDGLESAIDRYEGRNERCTGEDLKVSAGSCERDPLDYSTSMVTSKEQPEAAPRVSTIKRGFALFSNRIHVSELHEKMRAHLIAKNVETETAALLCDAIIHDSDSEWVSEAEFKRKLQNVLKRLVKGIGHNELLMQIREKNKKSKVFSFFFVGVNGVGKSTSLAKVCCWLLQHGFKVYIAACDTFRAGAIEQLMVHVQRFRAAKHNVGFYEKGYNKDDASVCKSAMDAAKSGEYDVILVDTAGRMHNKRNLMQSLTKLVRNNVPDHIIFVGEALVGSDSLEHLTEFNKAIGDGTDRKIDSILLTKVDTVDDKIGQVVNMTVSAHAPIIFLGTGQSNVDLTEIGVEDIASILMS